MKQDKKDIEEIQEPENEMNQDYFDFVKSSVKDGSYFKDALNWYLVQYVNPICQRAILIFSTIIATIVLFILVELIQNTFPLVEEFPVIIKAKDKSLYFPHLVALKSQDKKEALTVDEAIAKYLLSIYVSDREGYDFSKAEIADVNNKFNRIKNTSSIDEYRRFQIIMSRDNPESPINQFGKDVIKKVRVNSVTFIKKSSDSLTGKARDFISARIPTEAEVRFTTTTTIKSNSGINNQDKNFLAKISFYFSGANKNDSNKTLNFTVNSYKLYEITQ